MPENAETKVTVVPPHVWTRLPNGVEVWFSGSMPGAVLVHDDGHVSFLPEGWRARESS